MIVAVAGFCAAGAAFPEEARAEGYWYNHKFTDGTQYYCFWETFSWGGRTAGCAFEFSSSLYYTEYPSGNLLYSPSWSYNGPWYDVDWWWRNSSAYAVVSGASNPGGMAQFGESAANINNCPIGYASCYGSRMGATAAGDKTVADGPPESGSSGPVTPGQVPSAVRSSEQPRDLPKAAPPQEAAAQEVSTKAVNTKAQFPWKVAQNNTNNFVYGRAWKKSNSRNALGGSYHSTTSKTSGAFFEATGNTDAGGRTMELITATGPKMGTARVVVVNLATAKVVKQLKFDLRSSKPRYKVKKQISGLIPHNPYGVAVFSGNGRRVMVDAIGYEAHGNMCHSVLN